MAHVFEHVIKRARVAAHLRAHVKALVQRLAPPARRRVFLRHVHRTSRPALGKLSLYSFTSVITTCRAPAWRAMAADIIPIGPAPVTSTSSPKTGKLSAECVALPNGSKSTPLHDRYPACAHTFVCGNVVLGKRPRPRDADARRVIAQCRRPAQLRQCPHTTCPSPLTISPRENRGRSRRFRLFHRRIHARRPSRASLCWPIRPICKCADRYANAGVADFDENVARPGCGSGTVRAIDLPFCSLTNAFMGSGIEVAWID